jgi:hypothetical protein
VVNNASVPLERQDRPANAEGIAEAKKVEAENDATKPQANLANYNRLKNGMKYADVVSIIGPPSQELSRTAIGGHEAVMFTWQVGFLGANMNAMFENGRLVSKAQINLPAGVESIPVLVETNTPRLPGISLGPIETYMKANGFTVSQKEKGLQDLWIFKSTQGEDVLELVVTGESPNSIQSINATAVSAAGKISPAITAFMVDVASVRYANCDPEQSVQWIRSKLGTDDSILIGKVRLRSSLVAKKFFGLELSPEK